jgi:3-oxoadipate enol-lactonase
MTPALGYPEHVADAAPPTWLACRVTRGRKGSGVRTVLLLHAGIADSRMWQPQVEVLRLAGYRVLAPDLRGFGQQVLEPVRFSYVRDVEALLDGPTAVVGSSLGGRVALELAVLRPELVERLVVIAPGLPGWDWSDATRAGWADEETAFEAGDLEGAAEASLRLWIDGPGRPPEAVDAGLRSAVRAMVLRSYELQQHAWDEGAEEEDLLEPPLKGRLGEIRCPTLVVVGDEDVADMLAIAAHVTGSVSGARLVTLPGAAHLPSLERADEFNALLLAFLGES